HPKRKYRELPGSELANLNGRLVRLVELDTSAIGGGGGGAAAAAGLRISEVHAPLGAPGERVDVERLSDSEVRVQVTLPDASAARRAATLYVRVDRVSPVAGEPGLRFGLTFSKFGGAVGLFAPQPPPPPAGRRGG
ncbi:hypothetical protein HK405_001787, partial [Cladochytrium tenue]